MTISFSNCNPKNPKRQLWPQIYAFLFLQKILQLDKFEAFLVPKAILIPNFRHFIFSRSLTIMKIRVILIANMAMACFNSSLEITNKAFAVLNVSISDFCMKLDILKNSRLLIAEMAIVFSNSHQKYPNMNFSLKTKKFFSF